MEITYNCRRRPRFGGNEGGSLGEGRTTNGSRRGVLFTLGHDHETDTTV